MTFNYIRLNTHFYLHYAIARFVVVRGSVAVRSTLFTQEQPTFAGYCLDQVAYLDPNTSKGRLS